MQKFVIIFLTVLILLSSFIIYDKQSQISLLENQISELKNQLQEQSEELSITKSELSSVKDQYRDVFSQNYDLTQEINKLKPIYDYCKRNMVFVVEGFNLYHEVDCVLVQDSSKPLTGYNLSAAKAKRFIPCWLCNP